MRRRRLLVVVAFLTVAAGPLWAQQLPKPVGYVNDFANIISADAEQQMEQIIAAVREQTPAEIAVVTVESMSPYATIEDYGIALANEWKIGSSSDDAGVILILALSEREVRIEVGYGLEGAIPDGKAGSILDSYVLPDLREGDYGAGLLNGVAAVALEIADEYGVTLTRVEIAPQPTRGDDGFDLGDLFYLIFVLVAVGGRGFLWPLLCAG
ncbi:MAG: TPM domain-containing protein, partial [Spirochaetaceae bacterium]|nr:TPM domain-containing protein [Spirochaetaceae bacterium]